MNPWLTLKGSKSSPTDVAAKGAAEIGGDAQQKGEKPVEPMKKIKKVSEEEDHESDEDSEVIEEDGLCHVQKWKC